MAADFHITGDTKIDNSGFNSGISAMTVAAGTLISNLVSKVANASGDMIKSAVQTGMSFDSAMSQIAATMGTTVDAIQDISAKAQEMGATTKYTATEAAQGMNILAMAGLSAKDQIAGIEPVLNLASAGAISLEAAASYTTGTVKGFGDTMDNARRYIDLMAKGATMANTDVAGLGEALSGSAATASSYGQHVDSVTLALLRLAEQNVTGSEAATAMNRALADLYTPTDRAAAALEQLGVSAYDGSGKARDLNDVVDDLSAALSGYSDEEANALKSTIFTTEGLNAFNKMTVTGKDKIEEFKAGLAGASAEFDGAGAAAGQAATQLDNLEGDLTLLSSATDGLSLAFYNTFADSLRDAVQIGTEAVTGLTEALKTGGIGGMASAVIDMGQKLVQGFISLFPTLMQSGTDAAVHLINGLSQGLAGNISSFIGQALPLIVEFSGQLRANAGQLIDAGLHLILQLAQGIADSLPTLIETVPTIVTNIAGIINDNAPKLILTGLEIIGALAQGLIQAIPVLIENIPQILEAIWAVFTAFNWLELGGKIITGIADGVSSLKDTIPTKLHEVGNAALEKFKSINWLELGLNLITKIANGIHNLASHIPSALQTIGNTAVKLFKGISWTNLGSTVINLIKSGIQALVSAIPSALQAIGNAALNLFKSVDWSGVGRVAINLIQSGVQGLASAIPNALRSIGRTAMSAFKGLSWSSIGSNIVSGIVAGVSGAAGMLISKMKSLASSALSAAKSALGISSPSKAFKREVGHWIPPGIADGVDENSDVMINAAKQNAERMVVEAQNIVLMNHASIGSEISSSGSAVQSAAWSSAMPQTVPVSKPVSNVQNIYFEQPMQAPDEIARAIRLQNTYGLAGDY